MEPTTTKDIIVDILFSLALLICVWYFFIRDTPANKIHNLELVDEPTISLDDYEKELDKIIKYPKASPLDKTDWKWWDRENLSDEEFETLYHETKFGEKIDDNWTELDG